ncbi:chymotrypsin-1-like [Daphnia pulicaria]|uniref:chymotrypsin-1-like n=1 Tax=Daphnia pulicaria TaxID=35523 RepID=UPI001EEB21F5|nr:chymotrypsin-1-like [Daphnia pulicaria]
MKSSSLICVLALVAAASAAPQYPILYPVGSPLSPVQPCSQDEFGRLIPGGFVYPGQGNMQIGSWPWGLMNPMPFYPTDPRFIVLPGPGIPITSDNSEIKPISPTVPIPGITPAESKPREWLSSTPTVASRSRCLADYRSQKPEAPRSANVIGYMVASDIATPHQYPFMVSLVELNDKSRRFELACGASLISPTKILTAAHCVTDNYANLLPASQFQVKLGVHFLNKTTDDAQLSKNVKKIKIHEEYGFDDDGNPHNDIAILTLSSPVEYTDTISPICLVPNCLNDESGQAVIAMGWGDTTDGGKDSDYLRHAELSTVSDAKCRRGHGRFFDGEHMFCAFKEGQDTCQNDSGGPLVIENKSRDDKSCRFMQVGIVSFGKGCARGVPGVYVRVKNYLPWIENNSK